MSPAVASTSRGADVTKGVISLLGLLALVVVVPLLLVLFVGWPLPREVPSLDEITTALGDRYVPDRFLVGALAVVCWLVWTELVASVIVEAVALAKGRTAAQVPLARGTQLAAARLVAGIALLGALMASRGEAPAAVRTLTPAPITASASDATLAAVEDAPEQAPVTSPTYTVQQRDTLWDISERCLNDPFRWTEIWNLNQNQTMVDGRTFSDADRIQPGWVLTLPADASVSELEGASVGTPVPAEISAPAAASAPAASRVEVLDPVAPDASADASIEVTAASSAASSADALRDASATRIEVLLPVDDVDLTIDPGPPAPDQASPDTP